MAHTHWRGTTSTAVKCGNLSECCMRQFIWVLHSDSAHGAFQQLAQSNMVIRSEASDWDHDGIYTTTRAWPVLDSARVGRGLVHLHLLSGPNLNQKLLTRHLSAMLPDDRLVFQMAGDVRWNASCTQSYSGAEPSVARLRPEAAKRKRSIPFPAKAQSVNCR